MTLNEFEKVLKKDKDLREKLEQAKAALKSNEVTDRAAAMSKICAELGFDVPASEFALEEIGCQELDDAELEAVTGGRGYHFVWKGNATSKMVANWGEPGCCADYQDTDCWQYDYCDYAYIFYPSRAECKYDYSDSGCWEYDSCAAFDVVY